MRWNTINTVPQSCNLGRQSIKASHITAAEVAPEDIRIGTYSEPDQVQQHNVWQNPVYKEELFDMIKTSNIPSSMTTGNIHCSAMSQTLAALTLAGMATTGSQPFGSFSRKGKGPALLPYVPGSGGGPSGSRPWGGLPGGGGAFPLPRPGAAAGRGGGKLGGNPPRIFDGTCSEVDAFMNKFSLYCLNNIGADQIDNPMKRAVS